MASINLHLPMVTLALLSLPWAAAQTEQSPASPGGFPFGYKTIVNPTIVIIVACLMSSIFLICCVSIYVRQLLGRHMLAASFTLEADGVGSGRRRNRRRLARGLDPTVIDSFPTFIYSEVKGLKIGAGSLECAVCLNEFEGFENLRMLPNCFHVFHSDCIDAWLASHVSCPVCRSNLVPQPEETRHGPNPEISGSGFDPDPINEDLIVQIQSPEIMITVETPAVDCERFTLRLPEEVRNRLVNSGLNRTKSCVAFPRASSARKGYRSSSGGFGWRRNDPERSDRWRFVKTPPVFSRAGSSRSANVGGGDEEPTASPKNLLKSVTSPLHRLIWGSGDKVDVNVGERSCDRLRLDGQV